MKEDKSSQEKKKIIDNFYENMHHALEKAKKINKKSIFLIGQIRSGKSTTMNLIKDPQSLIGDGKEPKLFYSLKDQNDKNLAAIGNSYSSVTLVQNMHNLQEFGEEVSLIDLPGFMENRTEIQILLCSFIIKSCFILAKQVKFIFVIGNNGFLDTSGLQFMTTIKNFVKFFKYKQFPPQKTSNLFSSISILITAVKYSDQKQAINEYLSKLSENLSHLKSMSHQKFQISQIIDFAEQMLTNIIKDKRIQLFKEAIVGQSPKKSRIIENLNVLKWKYFDLSTIRDNYLSFPFAQIFSRMNEIQKNNVVDSIPWKLKQLKQLQKKFVKMIESYLSDPFNYEELLIFVSSNIHHEDALERFQNLCKQSGHSQLNHGIILNNINQLFKICEMQLDDEDQSKDYQRYCDQIISNILHPTIAKMSQSFALNKRQRGIFEVLNYIFSQFIVFFKLLCQVDRERISSKRLQYKDAILIANNLFVINEKQLMNSFLVSISSATYFKSFKMEQLLLFSKLIRENIYQPKISKICYEPLSKILFQIGQYCAKQKRYRQSVENYMQSLYNLLKHIHLQKIPNLLSTNQKECGEFIKYAEKNLQKIYKIYLSINQQQFTIQRIVLQFQNPFAQIHRLFLQFNLKEAIINYQNSMIEHDRTVNLEKIFYYNQLALLYEDIGDFDNSIIMLNRLSNFNQVQNNQNIYDKISNLQNRARHFKKSQFSIFSDNKHMISFINLLNSAIVKADRTYQVKQLSQLQQRIRLQDQQTLQKKELFDIDTPKKINFLNILKYTEYLIDRIDNRKVTFLIGESCGKTTTFCYLKNIPLIGSKSSKSYRLAEINSPKIRINYDGQIPTQIPNFGLYKQDEIIIDLPVLNSKNSSIRILYQHLFIKMIEKSRAYRFLIIVNQNDTKDCRELARNIKFLLSLFKLPHFIETKIAVLFSHAEHENIMTQTKSKLQKAINLLNKQKVNYSIEYKKEEENECSILITIMKEIHDKNKFTYFTKPNNENISQIKNIQILQQLSKKEFNFHETQQLMGQENRLSPSIMGNFQNKQKQWFLGQIEKNMIQLRQIICKVNQFIIKLYRNIKNNNKEKQTLCFSSDQTAKLEGITKQSFRQLFPFLFNTLFEELPLEEGTQINLIRQILLLKDTSHFVSSSSHQYSQIVPLVYGFLKFVIKVYDFDLQNRRLLEALLIKVFQKLQQWQVLWNSYSGESYQLLGCGQKLSMIRHIQDKINVGYIQLSGQDLLAYFCYNFQVGKFRQESSRNNQQYFKVLFKLFDYFQTVNISQQWRQKLQTIIQDLIQHEQAIDELITIQLLLFQIQNHSKFIEQDLFFKNSKVIDLIKQICKLLITFNRGLAHQICNECRSIELKMELFDQIYQLAPDKTILAQNIDYLMQERLFKKAMEKCSIYLKLYKDNALKQKYTKISLQARQNMKERKQITQDQKLQQIESFDIQKFLSFKQQIRSIKHI